MLIEQRLLAVAKEIEDHPSVYPDDGITELMEKLEKAVGIEPPHVMDCSDCNGNQWFIYPTVLECTSCGHEIARLKKKKGGE